MRGPKSAPVDGEHELFGFLTTEANAIVAPIHSKAMPVILTPTEEFDLLAGGQIRRGAPMTGRRRRSGSVFGGRCRLKPWGKMEPEWGSGSGQVEPPFFWPLFTVERAPIRL